ncbi:ABC transporter related protein [Thermaerobacter marianensis DSM 12885]|uniref:ABC transporter related protein n=1 Tax=Thermaerobacter marianensis (strain ATCC 700841 / DSM 12885 / JCM 10246 / 7p75a) TaxID=644966 RepID=E6SHN5_THEM7|nr:ABC transporter ATP-binding protein [Thermaerobacter marianensis]ADU51830.1 ABC transporter related protein [Thermaerobacter marianensis DSM 12885]
MTRAQSPTPTSNGEPGPATGAPGSGAVRPGAPAAGHPDPEPAREPVEPAHGGWPDGDPRRGAPATGWAASHDRREGERDAAEPAVTFRNVTKRYGAVEALRDVSFSLPPGTVTGLVGANGSGKSTLLKLAAGFVHPSAGEVRVLGRAPSIAERRQIAFVAEVDPLDGWMTVDQTVRFVRWFFPDWDEEHEGELREILELPGHRRVGELSKGMRTRVRLLLGLARTAPLVLLDEPFSGIDPVSRRRVADAILAACRRGGRTILLSTHDLKDAEPLFDRLMVLARGRLVLEGEADEIRAQRGKSIEDVVEEVLG